MAWFGFSFEIIKVQENNYQVSLKKERKILKLLKKCTVVKDIKFSKYQILIEFKLKW